MRDPALSQPANLDFLHQKGRVWIMGVLNATPDSFYAGSRTPGPSDATAKAEAMINEGADLLDVGGESTRPGAGPVPLSVELERVIPVIDALHQRWPEKPLSIDTQKADVARQAATHGASVINDVSALRADPGMACAVAKTGCYVVLMHMKGTPRTMQEKPHYRNIIDELRLFFEERIRAATRAGIPENRIVIDPGIGFGKTLEHNVSILKNLGALKSLGCPILVGLSRKSFLAKLISSDAGAGPDPEDRLAGTLAATLWAVEQGAVGLRVHDVGATWQSVRVWQSLNASGPA